MTEWYRRDGSGPLAWEQFFEERIEWGADAPVTQTYVGEVWVSTVFLALNHNFHGDGPPLIFETMVFGGELDGECRRWATEEQAIAGHREMEALVALEQDVTGR
jgi:hypothetical protein